MFPYYFAHSRLPLKHLSPLSSCPSAFWRRGFSAGASACPSLAALSPGREPHPRMRAEQAKLAAVSPLLARPRGVVFSGAWPHYSRIRPYAHLSLWHANLIDKGLPKGLSLPLVGLPANHGETFGQRFRLRGVPHSLYEFREATKDSDHERIARSRNCYPD